MDTKPQRRQLQFQSLSEIYQEAEHLLERGYVSTGKWNLTQTCRHLDDWVRFPMDGFPRQDALTRTLLWSMRISMGAKWLRQILEEKSMKPNQPTMAATVYPAESNDQQDSGAASIDRDQATSAVRAAVEKLRSSIERFSQHTGPLHPSPLFGPIDKARLTQIHRIHAAHHFSFLVPKT